MGGLASIFGGKPKKSAPAPKQVVQEAPTTKQEGIEATAASASKRTNRSQRSNLVSGRPGSPTRSGVNVPGRS